MCNTLGGYGAIVPPDLYDKGIAIDVPKPPAVLPGTVAEAVQKPGRSINDHDCGFDFGQKRRGNRWSNLLSESLKAKRILKSSVFPLDKIKIDKSFVWMIQKNPHSAAIIRAIVGQGRGLSMHIIAEGVETFEQLNFLIEEGCNALQGYLIGRPYPIEAYANEVGRPEGIVHLASLSPQKEVTASQSLGAKQ